MQRVLLVIEEFPGLLQNLREILEFRGLGLPGLEVWPARTYAEAELALDEVDPDLVVIGWTAPSPEVQERLMALDVPVVSVGAEHHFEDVSLERPLNVPEFLAVVKRLMRKKEEGGGE